MTGSSSGHGYWPLLQKAVHRALAPYPAGTATVAVDDGEPSIEIIPRNDRAAAIDLSPVAEDEVNLSAGETDCQIWDDSPVRLAEEVYQILAGVMAGTLEECRDECGEMTARVDAPRGQISFGSASLLPVPWSWRTKHRYEPYT
ncbi:MAG: hypothetical protein ABIS84_08020 [Arachnia sp.]